jgi:hypothetical protein
MEPSLTKNSQENLGEQKGNEGQLTLSDIIINYKNLHT